MGNIKQRVEDARFNYEHQRYAAALSLLLSAIDGSSRKVFPDGCLSIDNPCDKKGKKIKLAIKSAMLDF